VHGTNARAGQHGVSRFRDHRQINGDAIALFDAVLLHHVSKALHALIELAVGDLFALIWIVALPDDGNLISTAGEMAVYAIGGDVEAAILEPADINGTRFEGCVFDLGVGPHPFEAFASLAPKPFRIGNRARVEGLV
jgi:hypothetical protein